MEEDNKSNQATINNTDDPIAAALARSLYESEEPVEKKSSITDYLFGSDNPFGEDVKGVGGFLTKGFKSATEKPKQFFLGASEGIASSLDYLERMKDRFNKNLIKASTLVPSFKKKIDELGGIENVYKLYDVADDEYGIGGAKGLKEVSGALHSINAWAEKDIPKDYRAGLLNEATRMGGFIAPSLVSPDKYFKAAYFMASMGENARVEADHSAIEKAKSLGLIEGTPEFDKFINSNEMLLKKAGGEALGLFMGSMALLGSQGSSALNPSLWKQIGSVEGAIPKMFALTKGVVKNIPQAAVSAGVLSLFRVAQNAVNLGLIGGKDLIDDDNFFDSKLFQGTSKDAVLGAVFHYVHAKGEPVGTPQFERTANELVRQAALNPERFANDNQTIMRNAQMIDAGRLTPERVAEIRQNTINELVQESFKVNFEKTPFDEFLRTNFNDAVQKLSAELKEKFPDITPEEIQKAQVEYIGQATVLRGKQIQKLVDRAINEQLDPNKANIQDITQWLKEKFPEITDYELSEATQRYVLGLELKGFSTEKPTASQLLQEKYTPEQWAAMSPQEKLRVINEHLSQRANTAVPVRYYENENIQTRIDAAENRLLEIQNRKRPKAEEKAKKYDAALKSAEEELRAAKQQKELLEGRSGEVVGESMPMGELEQLIRDGGLTPKQVDDALFAWQRQQGEPRLQDQPSPMYDQPSPMYDQPSPMHTVPEKTYSFVSPDGTVRKFGTQTELDTFKYRDLGYRTAVNYYNEQIEKATSPQEKKRLIKERNAVIKQWNLPPDASPPLLPYEVIGKDKNGIRTVESNGKLGLISQSGIEIVPPKYDSIGEFVNGFAKFTMGDKTGFVDVAGKEYYTEQRPTAPKIKTQETKKPEPKTIEEPKKTEEAKKKEPKTTEYQSVKVGDVYPDDGSAIRVGFGSHAIKNPQNLPTIEVITEILEPATVVNGVIVSPAKVKTGEIFRGEIKESETPKPTAEKVKKIDSIKPEKKIKKSIDADIKDTNVIKNNIERYDASGNVASPWVREALGDALDTIDSLIENQKKGGKNARGSVNINESTDPLFKAKKQIGLGYISPEKLESFYKNSLDPDALFEIAKRKLYGNKGFQFLPEEGRRDLLKAVEEGSQTATDYLAESYINGHIPAKKGYGPLKKFGIHPEEAVEKEYKKYFGDKGAGVSVLMEKYKIEKTKAQEMLESLKNPESDEIVKGAMLAADNVKNGYIPSIYTLEYAKKKLASLGFGDQAQTVEEILKKYKKEFKDRLDPKRFNAGIDLSPEIMLALRLSAKAVREGIRTSSDFMNWAKNNIPADQIASIGEAKLLMSFEKAQNQIQQSNAPMPTPTASQMRQDLMPEARAVSFDNPNAAITYTEGLLRTTLNNISEARMRAEQVSLKMKHLIPDLVEREKIAEYLDSSRVETLAKSKQDLLDLLSKDQQEKQKIQIGVDEKTKKPIYKDVTIAELAERKRMEISSLENIVRNETPLTGNAAEVAKLYKDAMADIGSRAYEAGVIKGLITDYVTHIVRQSSIPLEQEGGVIDSLVFRSMENVNHISNRLTTKSPFAKERFYQTFAELEKAIKDKGLEVKTKDIAEIYRNYTASMERAIQTKNLVESLKQTQIGVDMNGNPRYAIMPKTEGRPPSGYSSIEHPSLYNLSVANELKSRLEFAFDNNSQNKYFKMALALSQLVKRTNVFGSLFHAKALGESFFNTLNPRVREDIAAKTRISEDLISRGIKEGSPEYTAEMNKLSNLVQYATSKQALDAFYKNIQMGGGASDLSKWIKAGITWEDAPSDVNRKAGLSTVRALDKWISGWLEKDIPPEQRKRYLEKIYEESAESKVGKQVENSVEALDQFTWEYLHKGMKFYTAEILEQRLIEKNRNITPEELRIARQEIAQHINTAFGGLNWFEMALTARTESGKNFALSLYKPSSRPFMQFLVFAPDWTISTIRQFKEMLPKNLELSKVSDTQYLAEFFGAGLEGLRNPRTAADFARRAQLKQAFLYLTLYNAVNYAIVGRPIWENKDPLSIDNGDGTKTEISKHAMEGYHFMEDPTKYSGNKLAFFPRAVLTMVDTKYRKSNAEKLGEVLLNMLPFQVKPLLDAPDVQTGLKRTLLMALGFPAYNLSDADRQLKKMEKQTDPDYYKRKMELEKERMEEAQRKSQGKEFREKRNKYLKGLLGIKEDKAEEKSKK